MRAGRPRFPHGMLYLCAAGLCVLLRAPASPAASCPIHFQPPATYAAGTLPRAVVVGDFNEDGVADLAVANRDSENVTILRGDGQGGFLAPWSFLAGSTPARLQAADFNGDGHLDLAVADDAAPGSVTVLYGNGQGGFSAIAAEPVGNYPYSVIAGDFNGDGQTDLAVADQCTNEVSVLLRSGDSFLPPAAYWAGSTPEAIAAADFNGDGIPDLAVADFYGSAVSVLIGNGDGTFRAGSSFPAGAAGVSVAAADFNKDGKPDIAVVDRDDADVTILLGNGDGTFRPGMAFPAGSAPMFVVAADIDGDGNLDLAIADPGSADVVVLAGNGDGTFGAASSFPAGNGASSLAVFDFNGDGRPDLAVTNSSDNTVAVLLNDTPVVALGPPTLPGGTVGALYAQTLLAAGGSPPYQFAIAAGALPAGLSLDPGTGLLSGTLASAGTSAFTAVATDAAGCSAARSYFLTVSCPPILVAPGSLPGAQAGLSYLQSCSASGGGGAYTFTLAAGVLPPGLTLGPSGVLSGTPASSGTFNFSIRATDASGCYGTESYALAVSTLTGPAVTSIQPDCLSASGGDSVTISGSNFAAGAAVSLADMPAASVTVDSSSQITATAPAVLPGATGSLLVTNPDGQSGILTNAVLFDFADVPASNPFHGFICDIARNQITAGCGGGDFCPASPVLRASMAVFLLRSEHGPVYVPPPASGFFTDLPASNPFASWVEQIYNEGIAAGCSSAPLRYCPSASVRRDAMAVLLLRTLEGPSYVPPAATGIFSDVPASNPFAPWIERLYGMGITGGCSVSPLSYCPADPVTRGQMAVFLTSTFGLL